MSKEQKLIYPCRVEGWLNICDKEIELGHRNTSISKSLKKPNVIWEPYFCVLLQDEQSLTAYRSEELSIGDALFVDLPLVRLDGGAKAFRHKWGYEIPVAGYPLGLVEEVDEENDENEANIQESISLREESSMATSPLGESKSKSVCCNSIRKTVQRPSDRQITMFHVPLKRKTIWVSCFR